MTVVISRPCGQCAHQVVCRIREALDVALRDGTDVTTPVVDEALEYDVAVDVRCAHFLEDGDVRRRLREPLTVDRLRELGHTPAPRPAAEPVPAAGEPATGAPPVSQPAVHGGPEVGGETQSVHDAEPDRYPDGPAPRLTRARRRSSRRCVRTAATR